MQFTNTMSEILGPTSLPQVQVMQLDVAPSYMYSTYSRHETVNLES